MDHIRDHHNVLLRDYPVAFKLPAYAPPLLDISKAGDGNIPCSARQKPKIDANDAPSSR
jgi:hypothetical protein